MQFLTFGHPIILLPINSHSQCPIISISYTLCLQHRRPHQGLVSHLMLYSSPNFAVLSQGLVFKMQCFILAPTLLHSVRALCSRHNALSQPQLCSAQSGPCVQDAMLYPSPNFALLSQGCMFKMQGFILAPTLLHSVRAYSMNVNFSHKVDNLKQFHIHNSMTFPYINIFSLF